MKRINKPSTSHSDNGQHNGFWLVNKSNSKSRTQSISSESDDEYDEKWRLGEKRCKKYVNVLNWEQLKMLAETDNYKNHIREAILNTSTHYSDTVEDAGVLMAIEEYGLGLARLNPLLNLYDLAEECPKSSSIKSKNSNQFDQPDSSIMDFPHPSQSVVSEVQTDTNFNFEEYAVNAAIEYKGLAKQYVEDV